MAIGMAKAMGKGSGQDRCSFCNSSATKSPQCPLPLVS